MNFRHQSLIALACLMLLSGIPLSAQTLDPDIGQSLNAAEMNVLGQKYDRLPTQQRLNNLEQALNTPARHQLAQAKGSAQYRVNQIYQAQQAAINQSNRQAAIRAYNRGIDESTRGNTEAAMAAYRQAIQWDPTLMQAYNNLASLQEKRQLYAEAIGTYDNALQITPQEPLLHLNLAIILEKQGRVPLAYDHYRQYVTLSPSPKPQIVELVKNYDLKHIGGKGQLDYSSIATQESHGEKLTWPAELLPIPVCIVLADPTQALFIPNVYQDFDTWNTVTNGRLRFREVGYPNQARITITLKSGPLMDPNASIGHASFNSQTLDMEFPIQNLKVNITVNTGEDQNPDYPLAFRKEQVGRLVLHEMGHAIGIWGHSKDPDDIMYTHPIVSQLSQRDINTVRKLYGIR